jgi:hypothetical protein
VEEALKQLSALRVEHTAGYCKAVIQAWQVESAYSRHEGTTLRLRSAVHHLSHTRMHEGAYAHQARLDGYIQSGVSQSIVANPARAFPERDHLGVSRRIDARNRLVESRADDLPIDNNHGADRDLTSRQRASRLVERSVHELLVSRFQFVPAAARI